MKAYPKYKDSGTPWLGEVPEHWLRYRIKHVSRIVNGSTPSSAEPDYWEGDIHWATPEDLGNNNSKYLSKTSRQITHDGYNSSGLTLAPINSVILSTRAPIGHIAIIKAEMCCNQGCRIMIPNLCISHDFLYYLVYSSKHYLNTLGQGSTFKELSSSNLSSLEISIPVITEQQSIAAFLDKETARIDALIQKKEQLIELLKEKRIALITQAVTKGLNPKAAMKDSGIEWIGEVPEHWEIFRVGIGFSIQLGKMLQTEQDKDVDELVPYLKAINVQRNKIVLDNENQMWASPEEIQKYAIKKGDLLVCEGGEVGRASILTKDIGMYIIQNALHRVRSKKNSVEYLKHLLHVAANQSWFDILCNKATIAHFTKDKFSVMLIPYPTHDEQQSIAYFLDQGTLRIDALISKINNSITLLHEYRSSLIHHAVTGKIDLRAYNAQN